MKNLNVLVIALFSVITSLQAQNYEISFAGSSSETINSVKIKNLTQETELTINGNDILNLRGTMTGVQQIGSSNSMSIYPNPMNRNSHIKFNTFKSGIVTLNLFDITGKLIISEQNDLQAGMHHYTISNLTTGIYTLSVKSNGILYSKKLISQQSVKGQVAVSYIGSSVLAQDKHLKNTQAIVEMQYNDGERLRITCTSSDMKTVKSIIPTATTTEIFDFYTCKDYDTNDYTSVTIGNQVWMAENLKATHYPNGTAIPYVTDNTAWGNLGDNNTDDAYCYYNNNAGGEAGTYGALYTWAAAMGDNAVSSSTNPSGVQGACPAGWHLPSDAEWTELTDYLGGTSVAG